MRMQPRWWSVVGVAGAMLLAGCGDDSGDTATTGAATGAGASTTTAAPGAAGGYDYGPTPTTTAAAAGGTVTLAQTALGDVLADGKGRTLYVFTRDEKGKSNCTGGCLSTWPPYTPAEVKAGAGVDASKLSTIATADGKKQVTIDGMPLYYFAADSAAGDTKGQGVSGVWYVVNASGALIK